MFSYYVNIYICRCSLVLRFKIWSLSNFFSEIFEGVCWLFCIFLSIPQSVLLLVSHAGTILCLRCLLLLLFGFIATPSSEHEDICLSRAGETLNRSYTIPLTFFFCMTHILNIKKNPKSYYDFVPLTITIYKIMK